MAITAQEVFTQSVRDLPPSERLRLAALILQDLSRPEIALVETGDSWSDEDITEFVAASMTYAASLYPEDEEDA